MKTHKMAETVCHRCGAQIRNVFLFQGNKYGSDCIVKIPAEEGIVGNGINIAAIAQGLIYAKKKEADLDEILKLIPAIGSTFNKQSNFYQVVIGYGSKRLTSKRKKEEFVIRVQNIFPSASKYNNQGWVSIRSLLSKNKQTEKE